MEDYSKSSHQVFEPRDDFKGNIARAIFYCYSIYGTDFLNEEWFRSQKSLLIAWHSDDPVDEYEYERNERIKSLQGNGNPFVSDRSLAFRFLNLPIPKYKSNSNEPSTIKFVTWNVGHLYSDEDIEKRTDLLKQFAKDIRPDVIFLQEVTSLKRVEKIRDIMGLAGFHVTCSNFSQNDDQEFQSLEVAVISRFKLESIIEYDPFPDFKPGDPEEKPIPKLTVDGLVPAATSRGFLHVRIPRIKVICNVTHLKSANGQVGKKDLANADKREYIAAAIVETIYKDKKRHGDYHLMVAGDFNVGELDEKKNGKSLREDCYRYCAGEDLYDDTHAIFNNRLIRNIQMRSLTKLMGLPTMASSRFEHTGPIDCIYVLEPTENVFSNALRAKQTYGSDHYPVSTLMKSNY